MENPKEKIILAMDAQNLDSALRLVEKLSDYVGYFKIGLELFLKSGVESIQKLSRFGKIFLDLKLYDIPATMKGAISSLPQNLISMLTVHSSNTEEALKTAVDSAGNIKIIAVTVLTSMNQADLKEEGIDVPLNNIVTARALKALRSGCSGVVCSAHEVKEIKKICGKNFLAITPGIRPSWEKVAGDDQKRVATPAEAISYGADMIVIGRAIHQSKDPVSAVNRILDEIEKSI